jgi:hypothetical protein
MYLGLHLATKAHLKIEKRPGRKSAAMKAIEAMNAMIAAAARVGQNLVVDHFMFLDPPFLQDCIWELVDVPVLPVNLKPSA